MFPFDSSDCTNVAINHNRQLRKRGENVAAFAARVNAKIQASAGPEAEHQVKRPLQGWREMEEMRTIWFLEAAGYQVRAPFVMPEPDGFEIPEFLRRVA